MKIYEEKSEELSWSIKLNTYSLLENNEDIYLIAVDSKTGEGICNLISFTIEGDIHIWDNAECFLREKEYNPFEYNNKFNKEGALIIHYGKTN